MAVAAADTRPFAPFEWMLAMRYLRARRKEGFISVIAGFSFLGIMLGVATLIIVMSVMNGFRKELFDKILGLNGHVIVRPIARDFTDYAEIAQKLQAVPGVKNAFPIVEGQVLMTTPRRVQRRLCARHSRARPAKAGRRVVQGVFRHAGEVSTSRAASPSAPGWPMPSACGWATR